MNATMITREQQMTKAGALDGDSNFIDNDSDYRDWLGFLGRSRDSSALERSNFRCGLAAVGGEGENVRVERFGHWACGWVEEIYLRPGTPEAKKAQKVRDGLEDYPIIDEEDFIREEDEEAQRVWEHCYTVRERIDYIRAHMSDFEFSDFAGMLGCVRGRYFAGYANELIN